MKHIKITALLMPIIFLLTLLNPLTALAAQDTATSMQLKKTQGTVAVVDKNSKQVQVREKMKLYDGYNIGTDKKSYAWIDLDAQKLIKLDEASNALINKKQKDLEIKLETGRLFFNVAKPLEDDESLNISTSSMAVGIRGTCGWVEVLDEKETKKAKISVLEGTVKVSVKDPSTGEVKTETATSGESVTGVIETSPDTDAQTRITKEKFTKDDILGFVLVEIASDSALAQKIYEKSNKKIDLRNINKTQVEKRISSDQKQTENDLALIGGIPVINPVAAIKDEPQPTKTPAPTKPTTQPTQPTTQPTQPTEQPTQPAPGTLDGATATVGEIQNLLNAGTNVTINGDFTMNEDLTIPAGTTINFNGKLSIAAGKNLNVNGTVNTQSDVNNSGNINVASGDSLYVTGTLTSGSGGALNVLKTGKVKASNITGKLVITPGGTVLQKANTPITVTAGGGYTALNQSLARQADGYFKYEFVYYKLENGTLTISGHGATPDYLYRANPFRNSNIKSAVIENGITKIGSELFSYCTALKSVTIPGSVTEIGSYAFYNTVIESITLPSGITTISAGLFYDCTALKSVNIPAGVTEIGTQAFYKTAIESINIPSGVTKIGDSAFEECRALKSVTIPGSVTEIGSYAFADTAIESITLPAGITTISGSLFSGCSNLKSINIPDGVTQIGNSAFSSTAIESITLPAGLTTIENSSFSGCSNLKSVTIPDSVLSCQV